MGEIELEDRHFDEATERGRLERDMDPVTRSVHYESQSGRIVIEFANGAAFMVPARALQGLQDATDTELSNVTLLGETGLHWELLDVDHSIKGLLAGVFGTAKFIDAQRRGGQSRSPAKIAASRANGAKGGRPKKALPPGK